MLDRGDVAWASLPGIGREPLERVGVLSSARMVDVEDALRAVLGL